MTWRSSMPPGDTFQAVRISGDGTRLVAIAGRNLYASDSSHLEWWRLPLPEAAWSAVALSRDGRRLFAAEAEGVIHQSDDGGWTWRGSGSPTGNWTAVACSADGERVAGVAAEGIFLSSGPRPANASAAPLLAKTGTGPGVEFVWSGRPGRTYQLIATGSLGEGPWKQAGAVVPGVDGHIVVRDAALNSQSFWQVLEVP